MTVPTVVHLSGNLVVDHEGRQTGLTGQSLAFTLETHEKTIKLWFPDQ